MTATLPTVSIVTVSWNAVRSIDATLASVLAQTYPEIEYLVVDGASTDGTWERILSCREGIAKVLSEPDDGIYQAMNKGLDLATGEFVLFLNADDVLIHRDSIRGAVEGLAQSTADADVYHGGVVRFDPANGRGDIWQPKVVSRVSLFRGAFPHPATLYRRRVFERVGPFDESFRIAGDYEWAVRALLKHRCVFAPIDSVISVFTRGGVSTASKSAAEHAREMRSVVAKHYTAAQIIRYRILVRMRKILGV